MTIDFATKPIVTTGWVHDHLGDEDLVVLDATFVMPGVVPTAIERHRQGHLPGAHFFDIDAIADPGSHLPHMLPAPEVFQSAMARLGVGANTRVVVYDALGVFSAPRAWWMFRTFGHDQVAVMDGGLPKWRKEGRAEEPGVRPAPASPPDPAFVPRFRPDLVRDAEAVLGVVNDASAQIVDARGAPRFDGSVEDSWPGRRRGHIPGSLNLPFDHMVDPDTKTLRPVDEIRRIMADAGVDPDRPMVASCGSGVTACVLALAFHSAGVRDVPIYDGSWAEWGLNESYPVEAGPPSSAGRRHDNET